ncbi:hypothetical protein BSKO_00907 [Bryopsis sp. KO-2023]|nr:hypothetical protein BSKO_00907 [Bryopsis sp. KO-2023]
MDRQGSDRQAVPYECLAAFVETSDFRRRTPTYPMRILNSRFPLRPVVRGCCTENQHKSSRRDIVLRLSSPTTCHVLRQPVVHDLQPEGGAWANEWDPSRRCLLITTGVIGVNALCPPKGCGSEGVQGEFVNEQRGYRLSVPSSWEKVDKAGADALFRDPERKSTNVGVTVYPVTVKSLEEFGTLGNVRDKLLAAERGKDGFIDLNLREERSKVGGEGALLYVYSYEINTTRGRKEIITAVAIQKSSLFIVNAMCKCPKDGCDTAEITNIVNLLEGCVDSFDVFV